MKFNKTISKTHFKVINRKRRLINKMLNEKIKKKNNSSQIELNLQICDPDHKNWMNP
jgi:hypothetical protein